MELTGAQIMMKTLIEQGVDVVFGYPGGSAIDVYDALYEYRDQIRHILTSHEQGASHAADGYSRTTGKVGVCISTSGPGATNLVTGIATAYLDSIPIIAITANVTRPLLGRDTFQEVDITSMTVPITKHNYFVNDISKLAETIKEAFEVAVSGRPGPVLIDIPRDVTNELYEYSPAGKFQKRANAKPDEKTVDEAAEMLKNAEKPVIYFGGGVPLAGAEEALQKFAKHIDSPLVASARGLSSVPYDFPLYLGMLGMHGTPAANIAVSKCDLLITVGARFSDRVTGNKEKFASHAKIIHIDIDESEIAKNIRVDQEVIGDVKDVLEALVGKIPAQKHKEWEEYILDVQEKKPLPDTEQNDILETADILAAVSRMSSDDTIIVTDVGQHQMVTAQRYKFKKPHTFVSSLGLGTMGFGLGAAIGSKIGNPDTPVVLITGDGCFHMNMAELAVAVTENLPITIFIINNGVLGMVRQWQKLFFDKHYSATTLNRKTDYVKLAEAMGAKGLRITEPSQIEGVLKEALFADGPVVVDVQIDQNLSVFPMIPPGGTAKDMIMGDKEE